MSEAWNMSTNLSVFNKNGKDDSNFKKLSRAAQAVEMDLRYTTYSTTHNYDPYHRTYTPHYYSIIHVYTLYTHIHYTYYYINHHTIHSNIGSNDHRTREGYKNMQKWKAYKMIENLSDSLLIHNQVRAKAKEE